MLYSMSGSTPWHRCCLRVIAQLYPVGDGLGLILRWHVVLCIIDASLDEADSCAQPRFYDMGNTCTNVYSGIILRHVQAHKFVTQIPSEFPIHWRKVFIPGMGLVG